MVEEQVASEIKISDSVAQILDRAFTSAFPMPKATAELVLLTKLPDADIQRVDELLAKKAEGPLPIAEDLLLKNYLQADTFLTMLKSKARRSLGQPLNA